MEEEPPNFGAELKDAFKPVNSWVQNGLAWMSDVESFFRERSAIEREYAGKLNQLAKKYFEKKARKVASLSVGDTPTLTPGSLESASMTTWNTLLTTTELLAQEHDKLGIDLNYQVAETMKVMSIRYEEYRQQHERLESKITGERDTQYSELKKAKTIYDGTCKTLEEKRVKLDKSYDSSKTKAERSYQTHAAEMHNAKNSYLISINVTNSQKEKYYHSDVPDILSSLQDLNETKVDCVNALWTIASSLSSSTHSRCIQHYTTLLSEISRNNPQLDSLMFIKHNLPTSGEWAAPQDFLFEPCAIWHDTGEVIVDEPAKIWLQNKIAKSRGGLETYRRDVEKRHKDVDLLRNKREGLRGTGKDAGGKRGVEEFECLKSLLNAQEELMSVDGKRVTLEVEVETVRLACGDIDRGAVSHKFKAASFKIPTLCDVCGDKIWGLSAKGMSCRDCGFNCHSKCEMKAPATCPGPLDKAAKKALTKNRHASGSRPDLPSTNSTNSTNIDGLAELGDPSNSSTTLERANTSASMVSAKEPKPNISTLSKAASVSSAKAPIRRVLAPPPVKYVSELPADNENGNELMGKMIYSFTATTDNELSVSEGKEVRILEPDDGGWLKIRSGMTEGLVPTAYVEVLQANSVSSPTSSTPTTERPMSVYSTSSVSLSGSTTKKKGPAVVPRRGAKKVVYAEALFDYQARTGEEFDMAAGDRFVLVNADSGDGWAEVEKNGVIKSVPSNYISQV